MYGYIALFAVLAAVAALSLVERRALRSRAFVLLRVLFPSWRFFDEVGPLPNLLYRAALPGADFDAWRPLLHQPARPTLSILLNAEGNLLLACRSLLEQLVSDLAALESGRSEAAVHLVSYELVKNLVAYRLPPPLRDTTGLRFQFKLTLPADQADHPQEEDILISSVHELCGAGHVR